MRIDTDNNSGDFYPRSPCGERLHAPSQHSCHCNNFYPRSPCGERRRGAVICYLDKLISIHALLAESDEQSASYNAYMDISIHALLAESDSADCSCRSGRPDFYPRSPCGERLLHCNTPIILRHYFYPRSPCGERPYCFV